MLCQKCGSEIPDGSKVCTNCGAELEALPEVPVKKAVNKKLIAIIGGAALVVIAAVVACILIFGGGKKGAKSATAAARNYVEASATYDVDAMFDCIPEFFIEQQAKKEDMSVNEYRKYLTKKVKDMKKPDIKFLECEETEIDKDEAQTLINSVADSFELSESEREKITDAARVNVKVEFSGTEDESLMTCIKYDGSWFVIVF